MRAGFNLEFPINFNKSQKLPANSRKKLVNIAQLETVCNWKIGHRLMIL